MMFRTSAPFVTGFQPQRRCFGHTGGGGFVPTDLGTSVLKCWLPGSFYNPSTGAGVDQSGNGNDYAQASSGNRPTAGGGLDGKATSAFAAASSQWISTSNNFTRSSSQSVWAVVKNTSTALNETVFDGNSVNTCRMKLIITTGDAQLGPPFTTSAAMSSAAWHILWGIWGTGTRIIIDGTVTTVSDTTVSCAGSTLGRPGDFGGEYFTGEIADSGVCDGVLSDTDINNVSNYLVGQFPSLTWVNI